MVNTYADNLSPIFQHPRDLSLGIVMGSLTQSLTVLKQAQVRSGSSTITFQVIAESHCVRIEANSTTTFCELLSCAPIEVESSGYMTQFDDKTELHHMVDKRYTIDVCFGDPDWHIPAVSDDQYLECKFPPLFGHIPLTRIQWQANKNHLQWWTLHTYPLNFNQVISVYTTSQYILEDN